MNKLKLFILLLIYFSVCQHRIKANNKKETLKFKVSFLLLQQDSTKISKDFLKIEKLYKEKDYLKSLELSLNFLNSYSNSLENEYSYSLEVNVILGDIYKNSNNHQNSIKYYKKALKILARENIDAKQFIDSNYHEFAKIYLRLGSGYLRLANRKLRRDHKLEVNQKDSIRYKDSARYYFNETLNIKSLDEKNLPYQGSASSNLSSIYLQDSLYDLAKEYAKKAVSIHRKRNNKISESAALGNLANIYLELSNYDDAKSTYKKALDLIEYERSDKAVKIKESLYENLAFNLYKLKDYEAYKYQEMSYEIKDSLRDKEVRKIIEELGFKHNFDTKKELLLKEEENKRLKDQGLFFVIGAIALLIIASLVYYLNFFKLKQKNLGLKLQRTELIKNKELEKLKSESQARILNATIDGKESERKEIAETLHDSVSALLSSANLHLQATRKQFNGKTPLEIEKTQNIITEASQKVRDLSHTLVSSVLLKFGLNFAIKDIASKYSNSELMIETDIKNIRRYQQKFEIKTYNIIQEFVNNILKHSKATNAKISLYEKDAKLFIKITDNGLGFDKAKIDNKDGLGINQIDARIRMMKGDFHIKSIENKGTSIRVELPVLEKEIVNLS